MHFPQYLNSHKFSTNGHKALLLLPNEEEFVLVSKNAVTTSEIYICDEIRVL